jgi:hypothetical protein
VDLDRGTVRIFLPGYIYIVSGFFIGLFQLYNYNRIKYGAICAIVAIIFILQGTRQSLATVGLLTIVSILFSKQAKSKLIYMLLIVLSAVSIFIIFQDIILNLIEVSQRDQGRATDNIRIQAATFFLTVFMPNDLAYFLGNGAYSANEKYGQLIEMYADVYGFYLGDIGLIGSYVKFGLLFALSELVIYFKVFRKKLPDSISFVKYVFVFNFLTILTGSDPLGGMSGIVAYTILLYLIDVSISEENNTS